ncbi:L-lactate 2-monooxygenase [Siccirubricoccus deserti]|nr:alpha-hydroxy acid oxidase [Siccirubricoccus deserti]GGC26935.1 L-lactate 2-monooxygenase [Siccirubricoccus deserti]
MSPTRRGVLAAPAMGAAVLGQPAAAPLRITSMEALEAAARAVLPPATYDWIAGAAGAGLTQRRNRTALDAATITPRMLTGVGPPDLSLTLLGQALAHPVLVAPMGLQGLAHPEGEVASARGAAAAGALFCAPMVASRSLEEVATAGGPRWFQLYLPRDRGMALDLATRAAAAGYTALVPTLDAPIAAFRERDLAHGFTPPPALARGNDRPSYAHPLLGGTDAGLSWADLAWFMARAPLPVVPKGVLAAADARRAMEAGAAALIVSSHGGRQFDGAPAAFEALPRCVAAVAGRVPVLMDSGPRRGLDVMKALAAGATAVAIGRPMWWGLALGGAEGVQAVLGRIVEELGVAMRLAGCGSLGDVTAELLN